MYIMINGNNGQPLSGLDQSFKDFVTGSILKIGGVPIPNYVWYACFIIALMWFIWNKTSFGKNMFAVGSNPEAANVSGVNVAKTIILVHTLAGAMYAITGFIESARIGSNQAGTGLNYECDAIAACVIGGVSFVGGTGKIRGVVLGVFILRIIFVALQFLAINQSLQYVIKGLIILVACAIDMRKYLASKYAQILEGGTSCRKKRICRSRNQKKQKLPLQTRSRNGRTRPGRPSIPWPDSISPICPGRCSTRSPRQPEANRPS